MIINEMRGLLTEKQCLIVQNKFSSPSANPGSSGKRPAGSEKKIWA